jgi:hypothetical protein
MIDKETEAIKTCIDCLMELDPHAAARVSMYLLTRTQELCKNGLKTLDELIKEVHVMKERQQTLLLIDADKANAKVTPND